MVAKIYIDEKGVPKWNPNWPSEGNGESVYITAYQKAKSEAVEFEDQQAALKLCWENDREIHNPLSFGHWQVELKRFMVNRFYEIEIDGRIEIVKYSCNLNLLPNEINCPKSEIEFPDCCGMQKKFARIIPEPKEESEGEIWNEALKILRSNVKFDNRYAVCKTVLSKFKISRR